MLPIQNNIGLYTDHYELTMAQGYFLSNRHLKRASFDYFFRKNPYKGSYVVFSGLSSLLEMIEAFHFSPEDCDYLLSIGFQSSFVDYLRTFRFQGNIHAVREGELFFPYEPTLRVEGTILETQLIETLLLNVLNFESLIATKASRIRLAAGDRILMEFGLRRAQGLGGVHASKAAVSGGFNSTSNVFSAYYFDLESSGTMAHSWIQSFDDELEAFRTYAKHYPDECTLLVDTYDTLKSGIPNAITVARELHQQGHELAAVRLDSGDLTYLSKKARRLLDDAGLQHVKIVASNQLDEIIIQSLLSQGAPIDIFGVGTSLAAGKEDAALDGVYKLAHFDGTPSIKVSENIAKMTLPGIKAIHRFVDQDGLFGADGISFADEPDYEFIHHPTDPHKQKEISKYTKESLIQEAMRDGKNILSKQTPAEVAQYTQKRLKQLPEEHKRFLNPHVYKVGISEKLQQNRNDLAKQYLKKDLF
ncbi:nicotinate phosphoribosyltransferase [Sunxiuqinia elliptica]|uniref:Nicotinate phosphoribosyltransferase n=1 Tax=Sunxiuqinia elliptica TaxID=655355 RepID=A0A4R6HBT5_9BACT|nr:nicotinate phosphoribosyltransferase [Sunxiuqinia elliptica]TDO05624.1 nicotinate phosphoribosyltransferase [Sunxiuqinia elliptica]TDO65168.1 nicotinate phosphoribosyltransferase [Sunxiuqinia elliptica]